MSLFSLGLAVAAAPRDRYVTKIEEARVDKRVGGSATSSGTSPASKASVPAILGFAVENGAIEKSTSGPTITLEGTALESSRLWGTKVLRAERPFQSNNMDHSLSYLIPPRANHRYG